MNWNSGNKDILQAITEHPDYPVYFMVNNSEVTDPDMYDFTLHERHTVHVTKMTMYDEQYFVVDDKNMLEEYIYDHLWEDDKSVSEVMREYDRIIDSLRFEPCILIYTRA